MVKISIAFLAAMSLAASGCHKNKDGDSITRLTEIKGKMCACKDKTCSDKVSAELAEWSEKQERSADKPVSRSESDTEKLEAVKEEIAGCLLKLEVPRGDGAAGPAGGAGSTTGSGGPAAGSAGGSAATRGSADGAAAGGAAAPAQGSAAAGSAH